MKKTQAARWLLTPVGALGFFAVFELGMALAGESYNIFDPYIDTQFARDYSPDKFEQVIIGMREAKVRELIGAPLFETLDPYKSEAAELIANQADAKQRMGAEMYQHMRAHFDARVSKHCEYTSDGKLHAAAKLKVRNDGWGDFAWYRSSVSFDSASVVIKIDKGWSYD